MKTLLTLLSSLALSALRLPAHEQAPAATSPDTTPSKPAAQGTPSAKRTKTLGQKMVQQSNPTDTVLPHKVIKK